LDRRAEAEAAWLRSLPEADYLVGLTGNPLDPAYITPKLVWLRRHHPAVFAATHRFLTCTGYIVQQFCGEFTCDLTQGYSFHLFDMVHDRWDARAAALLGVPLEKLPPLHRSTDVVGGVSGPAAATTGLRPGTPIIAGAVDAAAGALGAGVARVGQAADQGGTAFGMMLCVDRFIVEPRLILSRHIVPERYLFQGGTVGGGVLRWFWDTLGPWPDGENQAEGSPYETMTQLAAEAPPGANGLLFLPYMAGERTPLWNSTARGVFAGLTYATSRGDMVRALMEGCAFAVYHAIVVAREHDAPLTEWLGTGGAARSALWCQIKADISGLPFTVARRVDGQPGDNTLALAVMAAQAAGYCDDIVARIDEVLCDRVVYEPAADQHELYQELFQTYLSVGQHLQSDFMELARLQTQGAESRRNRVSPKKPGF
jgi:xylulokinase